MSTLMHDVTFPKGLGRGRASKSTSACSSCCGRTSKSMRKHLAIIVSSRPEENIVCEVLNVGTFTNICQHGHLQPTSSS